MNCVTIHLLKPLRDGKLTEIVLREPSGAGELRGIKLVDLQAFDVSTVLALTKRLAQTPMNQEEINAIGPADLCKLGNALTDFF